MIPKLLTRLSHEAFDQKDAPDTLAACPKRLLIVTDAWRPQVNGVVRTLEMLESELANLGVETKFITPEPFKTVGLPSYPEIRLSLTTPARLAALIDGFQPDAVHIATEGTLGFLARMVCIRQRRLFTTCYHTKYPEYIAARLPVPLAWSYAALRQFHSAAAATMVATPTLREELETHGFRNTLIWRRGIELTPFLQAERSSLGWPGPIFLFVGRVAVEKNIGAFLRLNLPGTKVVVGDGPARPALQREFPDVVFLGRKSGSELAQIYASADVFVFPSLTDTFGLVMLEALAAGTPVAAYPVTGPREVLGNSGCGVVASDLRHAALEALFIDRSACRTYASGFGIRESAVSFMSNICKALRRPDVFRPPVRSLIPAE